MPPTWAFLIRQAIIAIVCTAGFLQVPCTYAEQILLKSGYRIEADVLQERADKVFVDLGFTVLTIPRDEIAEITKKAEETAESPAAGAARHGVYYENSSLEQFGVKENVDRCGGAVVQVRSGTGLGSGFIINKLGYVITNNHVVSGEQQLRVIVYKQTPQGLQREEYEKIRILAMNPMFDLALLQIDDPAAASFPFVPLGDSNQLPQGQTVFAIGSPLGLERTVSQGIVSVRNREMEGRVYIQTTVQINPGNSGGPLFNLRGEVIGVNNMKASLAGIEGLAFAIPSNVLKFFLQNRDAYAFDPRNPNAGFRYLSPPGALVESTVEGAKIDSDLKSSK